MLEKFFKLKENGTTVRTEVVAGITTFITMAYILAVNPQVLSDPLNIMEQPTEAQMVFNGVFFATCIAAFVGTLLMGVLAKVPFAQAPGMGLNAFFAYTLMLGMGLSYSASLGVVFISGILFILITILGFREAIVKAIPHNIKVAISGGIGVFLAFVGLKNAGLVVANDSTFVALADFSKIADPESHSAVMAALLAVIGLIIIGALLKLKVRGGILIGIIATTIIGIPMGVTNLSVKLPNIGEQFQDFMDVSLFSFAGGLGELFAGKNILQAIATVVILVISFSLVDMFDTIGTLLGTARRANLLDEKGEMPRMKQALMCDAIATTVGAMTGTSTVTTFVESGSGIAEGGRTGLTSVVTAILFLLSLFLAPFIGIIPSAATAPALIVVGAMMIAGIRDLDFDDMSECIPAFLTIIMMPLTYSIANGIAFGLISYCTIKLFSGKIKETNILTWIIAALFVIRFFLIAM
ncbi:MAG: NCS2 family permease [Massiliimalia sp.]